MKTVTLYTDGACSGNPGPGGWGAILEYAGTEKELSGGEKETTNNRMELTAVIAGLSALKEPCIVELYADSKYVIDGLSKGWAASWQKNGWKKADKKPALNPDLWEKLLELVTIHKLNYHWVKGHAENEKNNRCDQLAVAESKKFLIDNGQLTIEVSASPMISMVATEIRRKIEIDRNEFMKRLRDGETPVCPECGEGKISTEYEPKTSHFFSCDKCDFMINID